MEDFSKKEEEFRKENQKLELKTKELLQTVQDIKKMQDFKQIESKLEPKHFNFPKSVDEMGTKGMVNFYKTKLKTTQSTLEQVQSEVKTKTEELTQSQKTYQILCEEKEKWFLLYNAEKNAHNKLKKEVTSNISKLQIKENEIISLKKETAELKTAVKNTTNELCLSDSRLKRSLQECEKYKETIKDMKQQEQETKKSYQNTIKDLNENIKQIQKHKNELLQGYKKQIQLIDNLKKQKMLLETNKVIELSQSNFDKLLDWKLED